jgi:hypothetical protein
MVGNTLLQLTANDRSRHQVLALPKERINVRDETATNHQMAL